MVGANMSHGPRSRIKVLAVLMSLALCLLSAGCAPKVVIQSAPPEQSRPAPSSYANQVSQILRYHTQHWQGVPHRSGGTDRRGLDCSGLVQIVFRDAFGLELPRTSQEQSRIGQTVPPKEMQPGDLVFFLDKGRDHIGVVVEGRTFLHVSYRRGVMLSELDEYWAPRLRRVQRILS